MEIFSRPIIRGRQHYASSFVSGVSYCTKQISLPRLEKLGSNPTSGPSTLKRLLHVFPTGAKDTSNNDILVKGTIQIGGRDIAVSQYAEIQRSFTPQEVQNYGNLIADFNPIHRTPQQEDIRSLGIPEKMKKLNCGVVVHGMLTASIFSSIFGSLIPGSVYRSQSLSFKNVIYCNETVIGRVLVKKIRDMRGQGLLVTCDTMILKENVNNDTISDQKLNAEDSQRNQREECVIGEAEVWLPGISAKD